MLVNNAGSSHRAPFVSVTDAEWQADLDLKLFGAIRLCRLAFPGMTERKWGRIINVLNSGAKAPPPAGAPTAVTRAAGMALTKVLAGEGAPHNVLVNSLHVGKIESDQWVRRAAKDGKDLDQGFLERLYDRIVTNEIRMESAADDVKAKAKKEETGAQATALQVPLPETRTHRREG